MSNITYPCLHALKLVSRVVYRKLRFNITYTIMAWSIITLHMSYVENARGKGPVLGIVRFSFTSSEFLKCILVCFIRPGVPC